MKEVGENEVASVDLGSVHADFLHKRIAELETQVRRSQKMEAIGTLTGGIAHDFNNLLFMMLGYTEMTLDRFKGQEPVSRNLNKVLEAGNRAKDLIAQLLMFSRQTEGKLQPLKIQFVVKECMKLLRSTLPSSILIHEDIQTDFPEVCADPIQVHQMLINVCINASDAMENSRGTINITLKPVETRQLPEDFKDRPKARKWLLLSIQDDGNGMSAEICGRIFEPGFTTRGIEKRAGMGLFVVQDIVRKHQGYICVDSEEGRGSTVKIYLPFQQMDASPKRKIRVPMVGGSERILVVDDEMPIVSLLRDLLQGLGYGVEAFSSSIEALETFRRSPEEFDLVVTDKTMPYMGGEELAEEILGIRNDIPIILFTGFDKAESRETARKIGIRELLMKPVNIKELGACIRNVLDNPGG